MKQLGNSNFLVLGLVLLGIFVIGGGFYFYSRNSNSQPDLALTTTQKTQRSLNTKQASDEAVLNASAEYQGEVLAGDKAVLLNFSKSDYENALNSEKVILLYFYANWCPICRAEVPKMYQAFSALTSDKVVGFRVNYNDSDTDQDEINLAREHGVAYQHTKVIVKNKQRILKSPETWEKQRYLDEIGKVL